MVKIGDTVVSVSDSDRDITIGNKYVVTSISESTLSFLDDGGYKRTRLLRDYRVIPTTPPQKIQQDGYEYELVGPVKPEWLVDGAWVVNTDNGEKRLVKEERSGVFNLKVNDLVSIRYHDGIRNQYRTHEPKDWKWGDWAMYGGKRVFVMNGIDCHGYVTISGDGIAVADMNWCFTDANNLTPAF